RRDDHQVERLEGHRRVSGGEVSLLPGSLERASFGAPVFVVRSAHAVLHRARVAYGEAAVKLHATLTTIKDAPFMTASDSNPAGNWPEQIFEVLKRAEI